MKCVSYQVWGVCYLEMAPHLLVRPHQDSRSTSPLCHTVLRVWFGSKQSSKAILIKMAQIRCIMVSVTKYNLHANVV